MKKIQLGGHKKGSEIKGYALVDDEDYEYLNQFSWFLSNGYAFRRISYRKNRGMHRFILQSPKKGLQVDHKNGNRLDNRRKNLRLASSAQNSMNRKKLLNKSSVYKGVFYCKEMGSWRVIITTNQKAYHLGYFTDEHHAALAFDMTASLMFGEFAKLNFPDAIHG